MTQQTDRRAVVRNLGFTEMMEKYPKLGEWMRKLSQTPMQISTIEWSEFCGVIQATVNHALSQPAAHPEPENAGALLESEIDRMAKHISENCQDDPIEDMWRDLYLAIRNAALAKPAVPEIDEPPFPWFINDGDEQGLRDFITQIEWNYFCKGGKDRNCHFLVFLRSENDETVGAIKSISNKRHLVALNMLKGEFDE